MITLASTAQTYTAATTVAQPSVSREKPQHDESLVREMVLATEVVNEEVFEQVLQIASIKNVSPIDVLFESGFIAGADKRAFHAAYKHIKDGLLHKPWAISSLKRSLSEFLPFEDMLEEMDLSPSTAFTDSALAELALSCGLLTPLEFEQARRCALSRGLTIGQSFVSCGFLTIEAFKVLIDGLARYRSGQLTVVQLRQRVKNANFDQLRFDQATLRGVPITRQSLASALVGYAHYESSRELLEALDLLVDSRMVTELSILGLMEVSLERSVPFQTVFEEVAMNRLHLEAAHRMQKFVSKGEYTREKALDILKEFS